MGSGGSIRNVGWASPGYYLLASGIIFGRMDAGRKLQIPALSALERTVWLIFLKANF